MSIFYFSLFSLFCVYFSDVYTVLSVVPVVLSFCAVAELYADTSLTVYCCVWLLLCVFFIMFQLFVGITHCGRGWLFVVDACHATIKYAELNCELDYTILFWSWMLLWKSFYLVKTSMFRGYYLHFVDISTFRGYYPYFVHIYVLHGYFLHYVDIIHISWILYILITLRATYVVISTVYFKFTHLVNQCTSHFH